MRDAFFLAFFLGALSVSLRTAVGPVLFWTWMTQFAPNDYLYSIASYIPYQKVIAPIAIIAWLASSEKKRVSLDFSLVFMLLFLIQCTIAELVTPFPWSGGGYNLVVFPTAILLGLLVSWTMTNRVRIHACVASMCIGLSIVGVWEGMLFFVTAGHHRVWGSGTHGDNNEVALLADMMIPLIFWLSRQSEQKLARLACFGVGVLFVGCVFATSSRGGFAGLVVLAVLTALFSRRKILSLLLIAALGGLFLTLASTQWTERIQTIQKADQVDSFLERVASWKMAALMAMDRPLTGVGYDATNNPEAWAHYSSEFDSLSNIPSTVIDPYVARAAHSVYFQILGDEGFLGLGFFLLMILGAFWNGFRIRALARGRPDLVWARQLTRALEGSMIMLLTSGGLLSTAYYQINYLVIGLMFALKVVVRQEVMAPARRRIPLRQPAAALPAPAGVALRGLEAGSD